MGWTGCGRARRRANVAPMCHYMPSKMMPAIEKTKHANLCNKNRSISAESVKEIATKFGCPSEYTTKVSKLGWIFLNKLQA